MKKIIIICLLLQLCISIFAQDKEPSAWNFKYESPSQTPTTFNPNFFTKDKLLFGFQWAASKLMNDSLKNNCFASHNYNDYLNTSAQLLYNITAPTWLNKGSYHPGFWYAPFMTYEPTLPLSSSGDNFGQILRPDDESNPIFGFKNRRVEPSTNPTDINYSRMVLVKSLASSSDKIVLNDIYPQPRFKTLTHDHFIRSGMTDKYLGKRWYLTINLRRLNPIAEPEVDDEIVLKLRVKYWLSNNTTAYNIVFDSIPMQGLSNKEELKGHIHIEGIKQII